MAIDDACDFNHSMTKQEVQCGIYHHGTSIAGMMASSVYMLIASFVMVSWTRKYEIYLISQITFCIIAKHQICIENYRISDLERL